MQEHKISKEDGTDINWTITRNNNNYFCLLYNDNKQKFKFTPNENLNCELFMIGGGGAGGYFFGGGGGAGASYINNNYTFKKNKTYTFEIGTGGMCDIADINKLFKSGLILNIYNNTNVNLLNINFRHDDYSSLGIQSSGLIQSFNVNNITIPSSIFHNNTTYIWDGYIKTNSTGYFNVSINSRIKTIIWVDKFIYNNSNALIEGNNITDVKIIQLEANRFYNIKIIAYNDDNNSNNFNISFEGCQLFNFDKNEEKYVYIPATDTSLTYRNDDNTFETIRCKGGGNGGCGFFNKNTNLDGGCGGGSGINKIKGSSIIGTIYNGYDGAVGDYCGGGGGIMSAGKNNMGGDGKIINWFNETLIFGAGGNAAKLSETRNLGYGCGGNGGECCYYSKLLINNNGNNGCILIYVKSSEPLTTSPRPRITEGFTDKTKNMLPDDSISKKLIENSFKISKYIDMSTSANNRELFFGQQKDDMAYIGLIKDFPNSGKIITGGSNYKKYDDLKNQTFIYDMLVISKLYAIVYRLYLHKYNAENNPTVWKTFCENTQLNIINNGTGPNLTNITTNVGSGVNTVNIANLFNIANLLLATSTTINNYNNIYTTDASITNGSPAIDESIITNYNQTEKQYLPLYHYYNTGEQLKHLKMFMDEEITKKAYYAIELGSATSTNNQSGTATLTAPGTFTHGNAARSTSGKTTIKIIDGSGYIKRDDLNSYYNKFNTNIKNNNTYYDNYLYNRIAIYLEAFNTILNTDSTIMLTTLKYYMHYYNLVVYNVSIQYGLTNMHNNRIEITPTALTPISGCYTTDGSTGLDTSSTNTGTIIVKLLNGSAQEGGTIGTDSYTANIVNGVITTITIPLPASLSDTYNDLPTAITIDGTTTVAGFTANFAKNASHKITTISKTNPNTNQIVPSNCTESKSDIYTYTLASATPVTNHIDTDLGFLTTNLNTITEYLTTIGNNAVSITKKIYDVSNKNTTTSDNFYEKQLDLNKTINEYNGELENFNNISFYYKLVIAFAILLLLIILVIFGTKSIDNNSKISVYVIIVVMIIIAFIIYKQYSGVKEGFTIILDKAATNYGNIATSVSESVANSYKLAVDKYITKLILTLATSNIDNNLQSSLTYIKKLSVIKNEKAEIYKIKKMNLMNSIEILKKNANFYYYMIIAIFFSIIILNIGLILYLLNSAMIMQIIILCAVLFIILTYYISYYIHKSTRLAENKNYWSNYNPSSSTFNNL
jgi:hypothetical protein